MANQNGFPAERPESIFSKPLKANFKDLFKSLGKAVVDGTVGKWDAALKDVSDATAALGLEGNMPGQLAWELIQNSLAQAIFTIVDEHRGFLNRRMIKKDLVSMCADLSLEDIEIWINRDLFERPRDLPVVGAVQQQLFDWLMYGFDMEEAQVRSMAARLPSYFVFALNDQWRK